MPNNQIENSQAQIDQIRDRVRQSRLTIKSIEDQLQQLVRLDDQQVAQSKPQLLRQWDDEMDRLDDHISQLSMAITSHKSLQEVQQFEQTQTQFISTKQTHRNLSSSIKKRKESLAAIEQSLAKETIILNETGHNRFVSETNAAIQDAQQQKQALTAQNDPNNADEIAALQTLISELQNALQVEDQKYQAQLQVVNQLASDKNNAESSISQLTTNLVSNAATMESVLFEIEKINDPRYLVNKLGDDTPFLLLPVRVETRYMKIKHVRRVIEGDSEPGFSIPDKDELWVRFFPDDIAIHTHEKRLTADEEIVGHAYWNAIWGEEIVDGIDPQLGAWRVITDAYGHERAAWIVEQTTPTNLTEVELPEFPVFPTLELKPASWTDKAVSYTMPDKFVVRIYTTEDSYREVTGNAIPDPLPLGFNPAEDVDGEFEQEEGEITFPEDVKWLTDFKRAEEIGMGMSIPLEGTEKFGIYRILVLGLKLNADKSEATNLVEELFENHHYTSGGFSLIKQGTPTNNTDGLKSGYERLREDATQSLNVEVKDPLFTSESGIMDKKDGQWFADLMGLDSSLLEHVFHADGTDVCEAIAMNRALWPATMGYYIKQMLHPHITKDDRYRTRVFFNEFVTGRGKIPAFRVDNQPYGVITGTAFSRWDYTGTLGSTESFYKRLNDNILQPMSAAWEETMNSKVEHVNTNIPIGDNSKHFLDILGLHASSVEFHQRFANGTHKMWNLYRFLNEDGVVPLGFPVLNGDLIVDRKDDIENMLLLALAEPAKVMELNFMDTQRLLNGPVIDAFDPFPFSELRGIQTFPDTEWNYIHWLLDPTTTIARIRAEEFDNLSGVLAGQAPPKALLYLLLRHAYLQQYLETSTGILVDASVASIEANLEIELQGISNVSGLTKEEEFLVLTDVTEEKTLAKKAQIKQQVAAQMQEQDPSRYQVRMQEESLFAQSQQSLQQEISAEYSARVSAYKSKTQKWDYVTKSYGVTGGLPMEDYVVSLLAANDPKAYDLETVKDSLDKLKGLPTARLERAFAEHLDLCNYRLDGWMNGLVTQRLEKQQSSQRGVYLGAFGMLENLAPNVANLGVHVIEVDGNQNVLSTSPAVTNEFNYIGDATASLERDPDSGKVRALPVEDTSNQGFIHTPSVNHAISAAILRAGYLAHSTALSDDDAMAVNLTSRRMRRALFYLEGVQNGQDLAALLGYRLERELHDVADVIMIDLENSALDQYILKLRKKYPLNSGSISDLDGAEPIEKHEARNVIDGLALLNDYELNEGVYEGILDAITITDSDHQQQIIEQIQKIQDDMDALADLLLSESVYQLAKGNIERSGAVLKALGQGGHIQKPEILETPRQSASLTHRFGIQFNPDDTASDIWTDTGTARSIAEPALNGWLSKQLPLAEKIAFKTEYDTMDGEELTVNQNTIFLSDLGIEPIDFIYLMGDQGGSQDASELSERIAYYVIKTFVLADDIQVRINYTEVTGEEDEFSLFQILALVRELKKLVGNSRALNIEDFILPNQAQAITLSDALLETTTKDRLKELAGITGSFNNSLDQLESDLDTAISGAGMVGDPMPADPAAALDLLRAEMKRATDYGLSNSIPGINFDNSEQTRDTLVNMAQRLKKKIGDRFDLAETMFTDLDGLTGIKAIKKQLDRIAEVVLGRGFKVYPEFQLYNGVDVDVARDNPNLLDVAGEMAVEQWTQGIAKVRENMANYQRARFYADSVTGNLTNEPQITQLPNYPYPIPDGYVVENNRWIGMKLPDDYQIPGDNLSLVLELPEGVEDLTVHSGMIVDEWVETIPLKNVHTGVAMHYNEPNAEAPNSLIMAVTPQETGEWEWDDLMDTLNETLLMAKKRAVEPDHLKDEIWGHVLPALLATISPNDSTPSLDFARNIVNVANGQYGHIAPVDYAVE